MAGLPVGVGLVFGCFGVCCVVGLAVCFRSVPGHPAPASDAGYGGLVVMQSLVVPLFLMTQRGPIALSSAIAHQSYICAGHPPPWLAVGVCWRFVWGCVGVPLPLPSLSGLHLIRFLFSLFDRM